MIWDLPIAGRKWSQLFKIIVKKNSDLWQCWRVEEVLARLFWVSASFLASLSWVLVYSISSDSATAYYNTRDTTTTTTTHKILQQQQQQPVMSACVQHQLWLSNCVLEHTRYYYNIQDTTTTHRILLQHMKYYNNNNYNMSWVLVYSISADSATAYYNTPYSTTTTITTTTNTWSTTTATTIRVQLFHSLHALHTVQKLNKYISEFIVQCTKKNRYKQKNDHNKKRQLLLISRHLH